MRGETNLNNILRNLAPEIRDEVFVFCTLKGASLPEWMHASIFASVAEPEGLTLVLPQEEAEREGLTYEGTYRCVSLGVHSSLDAFGLTAALSRALAESAISANMFAGYYHDHILVPTEDAERAMVCLNSLSEAALLS